MKEVRKSKSGDIRLFSLPDDTFLAVHQKHSEAFSHGETMTDALLALKKSILFSLDAEIESINQKSALDEGWPKGVVDFLLKKGCTWKRGAELGNFYKSMGFDRYKGNFRIGNVSIEYEDGEFTVRETNGFVSIRRLSFEDKEQLYDIWSEVEKINNEGL